MKLWKKRLKAVGPPITGVSNSSSWGFYTSRCRKPLQKLFMQTHPRDSKSTSWLTGMGNAEDEQQEEGTLPNRLVSSRKTGSRGPHRGLTPSIWGYWYQSQNGRETPWIQGKIEAVECTDQGAHEASPGQVYSVTPGSQKTLASPPGDSCNFLMSDEEEDDRTCMQVGRQKLKTKKICLLHWRNDLNLIQTQTSALTFLGTWWARGAGK